MSEWQPIETAPKDGTWILVFAYPIAEVPAVVSWFKQHECWLTVDDEDRLDDADSQQEVDYLLESRQRWELTHWMPLPDPPEGT